MGGKNLPEEAERAGAALRGVRGTPRGGQGRSLLPRAGTSGRAHDTSILLLIKEGKKAALAEVKEN